ncbi:MAG: ATP-binding protein, partial [Acidimicrobiia bacterium]
MVEESIRAPALLEREALLAEIEPLVSLASKGHGSMVLVAGEAGAGKTSLVREAAHRASSRAMVLIGGCDPLTTPRPLSPILDILSDPGSGLGDVLEKSADTSGLFAELLQRWRGAARPTMLIIEDVHWADEGTLDFVRFMGRRVEGSKSVVICTYRDDEVDATHPLRVVLGDLATRAAIRRLDVDALSVDAVRTLAWDKPVDPDRLHRITGGNAFYVTEVLAAGTEIPTSVQDAVLARVARLQPSARKVVEAVSVAPRDLEVELALTLTGAQVDDLDEATNSGVLVGVGERLGFRHELARAAVEDSIPTARRLDLHRRMIGLLVEEQEPDLARVAHHAARAQAGELVVEYAPQAAQQAALRGAHREAVSFLEEALSNPRHLTPDQIAAMRLRLGTELSILDRHAEGLAQRKLAVGFYRQGGDPVALARALLDVSSSEWSNRNVIAARAAVDEAIAMLEPTDSTLDLARALYSSGYFWMLARQHAPAMAALARCQELARECRSEEVTRLADYIIGTTELVTGDPDRGVMLLHESIRIYEQEGNSRMVQSALEMLGSGGGEARVYAPALAALERGVEMGLGTDEDYLVAYNRAW